MRARISVFICMVLAIVFILPVLAESAEHEGPVAPRNTKAIEVLTLAEAQAMTARNNPTMKNIAEVIVQADAMIQSAWSMLLPNINARASIIRNQKENTMDFPNFADMTMADFMDPEATIPMNEIVIQDLWGKSFGFSANMALFNPRSLPLIKMAYNSSEQTRMKAKMQKNEMLFAVTSAYYQVHSIKEMIRVDEENLKIAQQFRRQSESRLKAGQTTRIDVLRAEIQVVEAEKQLANDKDASTMSMTALGYLIGVEGPFEIAGPEQVVSASSSLEQMTVHAIDNRAELKDAALGQEIARRAKIDTWMRWLPSFDVTYDWSWNSASGFSGENTVWMIIFGAKWSLLEGGGRIAELKTNKSKIRMAQNSYEQLSLDIKREVETSHQQVGKQQRNVEVAQKQVELAEENHRLISRQYDAGLVTSLDVLSAATELARKRIIQVIERLNYDIAVLTLQKAAGEYHSLSASE
jgi:heterocyst glycolipid deposition protein